MYLKISLKKKNKFSRKRKYSPRKRKKYSKKNKWKLERKINNQVSQRWWKCLGKRKKIKKKYHLSQRNLLLMKILLINPLGIPKSMNSKHFPSIRSPLTKIQKKLQLIMETKSMWILWARKNKKNLFPNNKFNPWRNLYFKIIQLFCQNHGTKVLFYLLFQPLHMVFSKLKVGHVES